MACTITGVQASGLLTFPVWLYRYQAHLSPTLDHMAKQEQIWYPRLRPDALYSSWPFVRHQ